MKKISLNTKINHVKPPLKWAGGKRQLLKDIENNLPKDKTINMYHEPFIGGGAVLFHFQPKNAIINDLNKDLINFYKVVKDYPNELIKELKTYKNDEDFFYKIRALDREPNYNNLSNVEKAARLHYLNKTCYNGLYRVNKKGQFNAPFGRYKNPDIVNLDNILGVSKYFNKANISILNEDFDNILKYINKNDFVYLDPPYDPVSKSANFTGYTKDGFNRDDHKRLKKMCDKINEKEAMFLLSNSNTDFIKKLYKDYNIIELYAKRSINSKGNKRNAAKELLIKNYD